MSRTFNTSKRRVVNRRSSTLDTWDYQFAGERFGNQRKQIASLKKRETRINRARDKVTTQQLFFTNF